MRLLVKIIVIITITLVALVALLLISYRFILLESYAGLERRDAEAHVQRAVNALYAELDLIASYVSDWAPWDASYDFVQGRYPTYAEEFLLGAAYDNIGINLMLFTDSAGAPVYWMYYNLVEGVEQTVPEGVIRALLQTDKFFTAAEKPSAVAGFVRIGPDLMLAASHPIVHNDFSGPVAGYLVFARFVDADLMAALEDRVQLSMRFYVPGQDQIPAEIEQALATAQNALPVAIDTHSPTLLTGFALLHDLRGEPVALLAAELDRQIYTQGLRTQQFVFGATIALAFVFGMVVVVLLVHSVVRPISRMIGDTQRIAQETNPAYRLRASGSGEVAALVQSINAMLDRLFEAQAQIKHSEARNRALIEAIPDTLIRLDAQGRVLDFKASAEFAALDADALLGTNLSESFEVFGVELPTGVRNEQVRAIVNSLYRGETRVLEFQAGSAGERHDYELRIVGFGDSEREALILLRDISDRKQAELAERSVLLLKEVHHRVKNNLQVISSLLSLQARQIEDPAVAALFRNSQTRIMSMALIHEKLYGANQFDTVDFSDYVRKLSHMLFSIYETGADRIRLEVVGDEISLPIEKAVPFGLIVNELVSNALKHAFPEGQAGTIRIEVHGAQGRNTLIVRDTGIGFDEPFQELAKRSLGMQLVLSLVQQLGGTFRCENDHGALFEVGIAA